MAQTPLTTATPYCTALQLFQYHDWQQVGDMLRDGDGPRPTKQRILDATSFEGGALVNMLLAASGELETACLVGQRYVPADLAALTGAGANKLQKLVADLAFWMLTQRRQPASGDPKNTPGALQAIEDLALLRDGKKIFSFAESAAAGIPEVQKADHGFLIHPMVDRARRFFGSHRTGGADINRFRGDGC